MGVDILVTHLAERWELGHIYNIHIQLDHAREISANRGKRRLEIFKDLLRLSAEIALTNDRSRWIKSDLT